ncbi:neutrophil antibiotic peptide NP-2-like, partial [Grammomys surdaster]|uniref:neutrophil antibiotic peptide NP-2-like n=1 Tax=Grammomys surdaster TaxID=491861 RepID=UPI0010A0B322
MKMLPLLTTLLLLALQTQAESPQGRAEEDPDREQLVKEDRDISISFGGDKSTALQDE